MINFYKQVILPASLLTGTIIGAGIFSLPFIFLKSGLILGTILLGFLTFIVFVVYLMYADIISSTAGDHRFVGYARMYLGKKISWLTILLAVVGIILSLTIYIILGISFLQLIIQELSINYALIIFWIVGSSLMFLNIRRMAVVELLISIGIIAIAILIFFYGIPKVQFINYSAINSLNFLIPFGPIFFALAGRTAIPEMFAYFKNEGIPQKYMKTAIAIGTTIPGIVYLLFIVGIFGLSPIVSEDAISGLLSSIPYWFLATIGLLGLLSLWSSYIVIGLNVKEVLSFDLGFSNFFANTIVLITPPLLYFLGLTSFIGLVSFAGGVFLSLEGILIVLIWLKMNSISINPSAFIKKPYFVIIVLLLAVFMMVLLNELFNLIR